MSVMLIKNMSVMLIKNKNLNCTYTEAEEPRGVTCLIDRRPRLCKQDIIYWTSDNCSLNDITAVTLKNF